MKVAGGGGSRSSLVTIQAKILVRISYSFRPYPSLSPHSLLKHHKRFGEDPTLQGCFSREISHPERCVQSTGTILRAVGHCHFVIPHTKFGQDPT